MVAWTYLGPHPHARGGRERSRRSRTSSGARGVAEVSELDDDAELGLIANAERRRARMPAAAKARAERIGTILGLQIQPVARTESYLAGPRTTGRLRQVAGQWAAGQRPE